MEQLVEEKLMESYQLALQTVDELSGVEEETGGIEEEIAEDEKKEFPLFGLSIVFTILITGVTVLYLYLMKIREIG